MSKWIDDLGRLDVEGLLKHVERLETQNAQLREACRAALVAMAMEEDFIDDAPVVEQIKSAIAAAGGGEL